jgi:hypothetical protein
MTVLEKPMLTENQAYAMLDMQAAMNARVDPDWVNSAYPYLRAVVIEAAEAMEHHGWKWWKKQSLDLPQLQMELIDIWHFLMSELLLQHKGNRSAASTVLLEAAAIDPRTSTVHFDNTPYPLGSLPLLDKLQLLAATSAAGRVEIPLFAATMVDCKVDWEELFRQYTGKNVLNFFRQDHGYKEGSYRKVWDGREDNEHLVEIMQALDAHSDDYQQRLYDSLKQRYLK